MHKPIDQAVGWLRDQSEGMLYGEISVTLKVHQGDIVAVETGIQEKTRFSSKKSNNSYTSEEPPVAMSTKV